MPFTIATWNINSVRLREPIVLKLLKEQSPDVLCLQECKSPVEKMPTENFASLGYTLIARGQKGYNGVAILSRLPIEDVGHRDFVEMGSEAIRALGRPGALLYDIKGVFGRTGSDLRL